MKLKSIKTIITIAIIATIVPLSLTSCVNEDEHSNTRQGNFEALWKIIDEHYCFFDYKQQEYNLDWQQIYQKYRVRINEDMSDEQLFEVLGNMLAELRDGHVNLSTSHDYARYWSWQEDFPKNFSDSLERHYLGTDYKIAGAIRYRILDDNIGYMRYSSFQSGFGDGNLDDVLSYFALCRGLIIDIRNNGGGNLTYAEKLAARFAQERTLVGYMQHKTGPGHKDFSDMEPQYLEPSARLRWHKPVCLLINRSVFSSANEFTMYMKQLPMVKLIGDRTGGGAGLPFSSSLPNGWGVRFSACPMYDAQKKCTEFGIEPDYYVSMTPESVAKNQDDIIEKARKVLIEDNF